jgi:uncharacterized membrane protein SpoIIM required for sporulation
VQFRREREAEWRELETLVERVLTRGLKSLGEQELHRLPVLYRHALSSLSVARRTAMDRALVQYLEALAGRAYLAVYGSRRPSRAALMEFVRSTFPRMARSLAGELGLATLLFGLGIAVAFALTSADPEWYYAFVGEGMAAGRTPAASTESLREALYDGGEGMFATFASFLFTHNARIGMLAFALGFAAGLPSALLLFVNGLTMGAFLSLYAGRGLLVPLLGWLLPHGVPEIGALLLCGAAGLHLGRSILWPGRLAVRESMVRAGRRSALVVAGCVLLFAFAGGIEGVFRQLVDSDGIRFGLAAFNLLWIGAWLLFSGSHEDPGEPR